MTEGATFLDERAAPDRPLFDLADHGVGYMLDTDPPERQWLFRDFLPHNVVGVLAAAGETGKTMGALQLLTAIGAELPIWGMTPERGGGVLLIAAEDDTAELHRRMRAILASYEHESIDWSAARERLCERAHIVSRVGVDNMLTRRFTDGVCAPTALADRLFAAVESLPDPALIVLDPLSRFHGGEQNANEDATRFIEVLEQLRQATGATVLVTHHVNKLAIREGQAARDALRGATGLPDAARWVGTMASLRRDHAPSYGIDEDDAGRYVRLDAWSNYIPPWPGLWLERSAGGVLVPTNLSAHQSERQQRRAEDRYREVLPKLRGLVQQRQEQGEPITRNRLRDYAGKSGLFGVGDQTLRGIVERALAEGEIRAYPTQDGRRVELRTW